MNNQEFTTVRINPTNTNDSVKDLEEKLEKARQMGAANNLDEILTGIYERSDVYSSNTIRFNVFAALFPKKSLIECKMFETYPYLFIGPYLSELSHVYTGKNIKHPEKVLVHVRSNKMFQGKEKVSVSHAGYCKYGEHPAETAKREFKEELKKFNDVEPIFVENSGCGLEKGHAEEGYVPPKCLDITMHYMGPNRIKNPVLGFIQYVEPKTAERYPTVDSLNKLNELCTDTKDFEFLGTAWVPYNNLRQFWSEVAIADRVYSISRESTENLMACFDKLAK